jgi:acyl carrier protein phosphodiesterase
VGDNLIRYLYNGCKYLQKLSCLNYLAHIYLSGANEEILVGNFIGDYVKGFELTRYSETMRKGIMLHRHIDSFTDTNLIVKRSKSHVVEKYRKYAGIIIDIIYDHFLVNSWPTYSNKPIEDFILNVHDILHRHLDSLPEGVRLFLPSFIKNNWIQKYSTIEGIEDVLHKMSSRTTLPEETEYAIRVLREDYDKFQSEFSAFFPSLISYVSRSFGIILDHEEYPSDLKAVGK